MPSSTDTDLKDLRRFIETEGRYPRIHNNREPTDIVDIGFRYDDGEIIHHRYTLDRQYPPTPHIREVTIQDGVVILREMM